MKIHGAEGVGYKEATDFVIEKIMNRYSISRKSALKLYAEAIIRNCVIDELMGECDYLIGWEEKA